MLKIVHYPHPILQQVLQSVTVFNEDLPELIEQMIETMHLENGIGLAANQVGVNKRIFVMQVNKEEKPYVFINPHLNFTNLEKIDYTEGCLSFPGIKQEKERYNSVNVTWVDQYGLNHTQTFYDLEAICIQHENDHINGITFIDDLSPLKKQFALKKLNKPKKKKF